MSVLIKNINIPKCCSDCPLNYDQMSCIITGTEWWSDKMILMDFDSDKERLYNCPLIEIPTPHGRLIDADAFADILNEISIMQKYDKLFSDNVLSVGDIFNAVSESLKGEGIDGFKLSPTVIEAEGVTE